MASKYLGVERSTFVLDAEGVVLRHEWRKVKVKGHAEAVLAAVKIAVNGIVTVRPGAGPRRREDARAGRKTRRIFVLDTNVLMHDPTSIFRFEEHDVYIPMTVLEELDAGKKGRVRIGAQRAPGKPLPR